MIIRVLLGFLLFIAGIFLIKRGFNLLYTERLKESLSILSEHFLLASLVGAVLTVLIQSSSATIVIVISLLATGLLSFQAALAVLMGANVGTTFTLQLISVLLTDYIFHFILTAGVLSLIYQVTKLKLFKVLATILFGLALLYQGIDCFETAAISLKRSNYFINSMALLRGNILLGIPIGILFTALIQSSSTFTAMIVVLARAKLVELPAAITLALGSNLGTCVTAALAVLNQRSRDSLRLLLAHILFNLVGIIIIMPILPFFIYLIRLTSADLVHQIANAHTLFNLLTFIILFALRKKFIKLLKLF